MDEPKKVQRLVQEERNARGGFGGTETNNCETKNVCHRHRK